LPSPRLGNRLEPTKFSETGAGEMRAYPYLLKKDASGQRLNPIGAKEAPFDEIWLQEVIRRHPKVLPVADIEVVFSPMVSIGREVATDAGSVDNMFISSRGYLTIVETKLWRNPEARRTVVAQVMDYANALSKWTYSQLDSAVREYTKRYERPEASLADVVQREFDSLDGGTDFFIETVEKNLRLGRMLALIVGDRIRESAVEVASFVNKQPGLALNLALIELQCFKQKEDSDWPLLLVPTVVKRTEIVERSVVQVSVLDGRATEIRVEQEKTEPGRPGKPRVSLTEEAFWELFSQRSRSNYPAGKRLIDKYRSAPGVGVYPGGNSLAVRYDMHDTGQLVSLFFITTNGRLVVWPDTLAAQLQNVGYDPRLVDDYRSWVKREFKASRAKKEFSAQLASLDLQRFPKAVDAFLDALEKATPVE
jgi:hypothetical protein